MATYTPAFITEDDTGWFREDPSGDLVFRNDGTVVHRLRRNDGAVAVGEYGPRVLTKRQTITAAQLRQLAAAPVTLVAAPGAGKALLFRSALVEYVGGANIFDSVGAGEDLQIRYTDGSGALASSVLDTTTDINFGATTDAFAVMEPLSVNVIKLVENAALVLDNVGAGELAAANDDANGDGTVIITLVYEEWTLANPA